MSNLILAVLLCQTPTDSPPGFVTVRGVVTIEDGEPAANFQVLIPPKIKGQVYSTTTNERGQFALKVPPELSRTFLVTVSPDGRFMGWSNGWNRAKFKRITAKPSHEIRCTVRDENGSAVRDARVATDPQVTVAPFFRTDAAGQCLLRVPAEARIDTVFAIKDGVGLDYYTTATVWPPAVERPLPPVVLELGLAVPADISVRLIDKKGEPVRGIRVLPWTVKLPDQIARVNLAGATDFCEVTDENGVARINWVPRSALPVTILLRSQTHNMHEQLVVRSDEKVLNAVIHERVRVTGKVTLPDGSPRAGIRLQAQSNVMNYLRTSTLTDSEGNYSFLINPDEPTAILLTDRNWVSTARTITIPHFGERKDVNFKATEGAIISGKLTGTDGSKPDLTETVGIKRFGLVHDWFDFDTTGRYSGRVGPGEHQLFPPGGKEAQSIKVRNGDRLTRNFQIEPVEQFNRLVVAVLDEDGQRVSSAPMVGVTRFVAYQGVSDIRGELQFNRDGLAAIICSHPEKPIAGLIVVDGTEATAVCRLAQAHSVTGRLMNAAEKPIPKAVLRWRIQMEGFKPMNLLTTTNEHGRFTFPAVPRNLKGMLWARVEDSDFELKEIESTVDRSQALGDIRIDE